jgi:hypothetical protein
MKQELWFYAEANHRLLREHSSQTIEKTLEKDKSIETLSEDVQFV